jgi:excisionase family DNA binding protein
MTDMRKPVASVRPIFPMNALGTETLMTSHQAAQLLGVHPRTLQRMVLRGEITGVRVGKLWRFVPSAIREWVQERNIAC